MNIELLARLTRMNYHLREMGILPDKWYWADRMMWQEGYALDSYSNLCRVSTVHPQAYQDVKNLPDLKQVV